jgi:5'(3')-deoxyribonucleotidase
MARIAVDMDEVMADALGEHLDRYNSMFGTKLTRQCVTGINLHHSAPAEHRAAIRDFVNCHDFFASLKVMPGAQDVLKKLSQKHEIFVTTAAMEVPASFAAKYEWLLEHFPFISPMNFVFCGDKSIVLADYLIDDTARHFAQFKGTGILFDAPHNRNVTGYLRVINWFEVEEFFAGTKIGHSDFHAASTDRPSVFSEAAKACK